MGNQPTFQRIGHRGAPTEFAENTLPSFRQAFARGADAIELDVHTTADGVVVVHHDPVLPSTGAGMARPIAALAWAELRTVELGPGVTVPPLEDVLDLVAGTATAYVEIKG